jgi:hypothetical protein
MHSSFITAETLGRYMDIYSSVMFHFSIYMMQYNNMIIKMFRIN